MLAPFKVTPFNRHTDLLEMIHEIEAILYLFLSGSFVYSLSIAHTLCPEIRYYYSDPHKLNFEVSLIYALN